MMPSTNSSIHYMGPGLPTHFPPYLARWLRWEHAILLGLATGFWASCLLQQSSIASFGYRTDFLGVYVGARAAATGRGSQLYDVQVQQSLMDAAISPYRRGRLMPFIYPAYVALLFRPLGSLAFGTALRIWLLTNLAVALWTAARLASLFAGKPFAQVGVFIAFFAWVPFQLALFQGQLGILPALGMIQALVALRSGHDWRAGWWLSLGLVKPQLVLFPLLVFMVWRRWRAVAAFFLALAGILGISIVALGSWIVKYLHFLMEYNRRGADLSLYPGAMQNWRGLVYSLFKTDESVASLSVLLLLSVASILIVFGLCYAPSSRSSNKLNFGFSLSFQEEARYAIAVLLGLLSSPHLYMHDWVVALPAGFVLWFFARESYSQDSPKRYCSGVLLWLLGVAPAVFFGAQFFWSKLTSIQLVPLYVVVLVGISIATLENLRTVPQIEGETHPPTPGERRPGFVVRPR